MGTRIAALASSAVAVLALTACGSGGSDAAGSSAARSSAASASSGSTAGMPSAPTATNGTGSAGAGTTGTTAPTPRAPAATYGSSTGTTTRAARPSTGTQGGGQVTGATGGLKVYLEAHLADVNAGDGCDVNIRVDKRVGGYARGSYFAPECDAGKGIWAYSEAADWHVVHRGQEPPQCTELARLAPQMPTSIAGQCLLDGKAVTWRPGLVAEPDPQVTGATGELRTYLVGRLRTMNAGDGCDLGARVDERVGGYARGSYFAPECEGAAALWAQGANGWSEVWSGQDTPTCATLRSRAPGMPTSIVDTCVGDAGKAEPWRPTR
ncbi:hypothetical protein [Arsenicicoccus sp. UBA7492]|uniref:hypothetical protein n=1 Tax=Arsenicicoccus sp. UBA7492 TaxID=1946057 RepID=UPI00257BF346|nr:hypothetical protein [Arsenicicoccus sp. UBA7492]